MHNGLWSCIVILFNFHTFLPGKEYSCQCTQGNMAHLQTHKISEEDRSCQSAQTSAQVLAGHSPVSKMFLHFTQNFSRLFIDNNNL